MFLSLKKPYPIKIIQYIKLKNTDINLLRGFLFNIKYSHTY